MPELEENTDSKGFKRLRKEVSRKIGVDYDNYSKRHLRRRFHARMRVVETPKFEGYLDYIKKHEEEIEELRDLLTVNVTRFKRDEEVWEIIEDELIPELIENKGTGVLDSFDVWSAGCATGEEPYSLAISYLKNNPPANLSFSVTATDLDNEALDFARNGEYPSKSIKNLSESEKRKFFKDKKGGWQVKGKVKELVEFKEKDIFKTSFKKKFDLILCRNLMIYFNNEAKSKLMERLVESLSKGGYLVIGMSENLRSPAKDKVESYNLKRRVFKR